MSRVAVLDIGKTNAKLAVVDTGAMREVGVLSRPNRVVGAAPYPHYDVDAIWSFLTEGLSALHARHGIDAITVTTHGAAAALLDAEGGLACPILDYEHAGPEATAAAYDTLRPPFAETGSPRLPLGLNLGAQLHWLLETQRGLDARLARIVTYPQFWTGRLSGVHRCDRSSLGAHTDLWAPWQGRFSSLADRLGIRARLAPLARADARLGPVLPEVARATGLDAGTPVFCGIHDSNASLLPHLRHRAAPFTVVSTGTWVISMAVGGREVPLDPARDTLANVDAEGRPVPSARFMGGREYERLSPEITPPGPADEDAVLSGGLFLLPAIDRTSGPFADRAGGWSDPAAPPAQKSVALSFYLALMTAECLELIGADGATVVEGPFARSPLYLDMLCAVTGRPVVPAVSGTGTAPGAAMLAGGGAPPAAAEPHAPGRAAARLQDYARRWRAAVREGRPPR